MVFYHVVVCQTSGFQFSGSASSKRLYKGPTTMTCELQKTQGTPRAIWKRNHTKLANMSGNPGYTTPQQGQRHNPIRDESWVQSFALRTGTSYPADDEIHGSNPPSRQPRSNATSMSMPPSPPPQRSPYTQGPVNPGFVVPHEYPTLIQDYRCASPVEGFLNIAQIGQTQTAAVSNSSQAEEDFFRRHRHQRHAKSNKTSIVDQIDRELDVLEVDTMSLEIRVESTIAAIRGRETVHATDVHDLKTAVDTMRSRFKAMRVSLSNENQIFPDDKPFGKTEYDWMNDRYKQAHSKFNDCVTMQIGMRTSLRRFEEKYSCSRLS